MRRLTNWIYRAFFGLPVVLLDDAKKFLVEEGLPPDLKRAKAAG